MRRFVSSLSVALVLVALALVLFQPYPARTARAADINERCNDCLLRTQAQYERCQAQFGFDTRCDEQFNRDIVNCYRQFCEQ
jgi:ABC-type dipeptide/oligopeptide/nickel transport system permease component